MNFLEGVRVLDASRILAGPLDAQVLGDMGADVLKVESPEGDDARAWGPPFQDGMSAYFQSCNRNKSSLALDLKQTPDQERLQRLVAHSDVWIDNFPPDVKRRLNLTADDLRRFNADLIIADLTSYPTNGSDAEGRGYDLVLQAETGMMGLIGPLEGHPCKVGQAVIDVMAGMMVANGILGAKFKRGRGHVSSQIEVSLYHTALFSLVNVATNYLQSGEPSFRYGNAHPNIVPYESFPTADQDIVIAVGNDDHFARLCQMLGLMDSKTSRTNGGRVRNGRDLIDQISRLTAQWSSKELVDALKGARIPCTRIMRPDEALAASRTRAPDAMLAIVHPSLGRIQTIANPIRSRGMLQLHEPPPSLNERGSETERRWIDATKDSNRRPQLQRGGGTGPPSDRRHSSSDTSKSAAEYRRRRSPHPSTTTDAMPAAGAPIMTARFKIILHAGMHKTATTALQAVLACNRAALLEQGFYYPGTGGQHHNAIVNLRLPDWQPDMVADQVARAKAVSAGGVIFSAEVISILSPAEIRRLCAQFKGERIVFVFAFRHWCEFLPPRWAQNCRIRDSQSFSSYLRNLRSFPGGHLDARYDQILQRFRGNTDAEIRAVSYSNSMARGRSVVCDLLQAMGLPDGLRNQILIHEQKLNTSRDWVETEQIRLLNGALSHHLGLNQNDLFQSLGHFDIGNLSYRLRLQDINPSILESLAPIIEDRGQDLALSSEDPWIEHLDHLFQESCSGDFVNLHHGRTFAGDYGTRVHCTDLEWHQLRHPDPLAAIRHLRRADFEP